MNDKKLVCNCMNITIADIRNAVKNGADTFDKVQSKTGASTSCKRCIEYAENVFKAIMDGE